MFEQKLLLSTRKSELLDSFKTVEYESVRGILNILLQCSQRAVYIKHFKKRAAEQPQNHVSKGTVWRQISYYSFYNKQKKVLKKITFFNTPNLTKGYVMEKISLCLLHRRDLLSPAKASVNPGQARKDLWKR